MPRKKTGSRLFKSEQIKLAENIKRFREQRNMTQVELGGRTGMHNARISDLEAGKGNPTLETLLAIALALGVTTNDLIGSPDLGISHKKT